MFQKNTQTHNSFVDLTQEYRKSQKPKIVIFCQWTEIMSILEKRIKKEIGVHSLILQGKQRRTAVLQQYFCRYTI